MVFNMEKHLVVEKIIVKINNPTKKISLRILITRQPGNIEVNMASEGKNCNSLTILLAWMILTTF